METTYTCILLHKIRMQDLKPLLKYHVCYFVDFQNPFIFSYKDFVFNKSDLAKMQIHSIQNNNPHLHTL